MHAGLPPGLWLPYNLDRFSIFPSVQVGIELMPHGDHKAELLPCSRVLGSCSWLLLLEEWQVSKVSERLEKKMRASWRRCPQAEQAVKTKALCGIPVGWQHVGCYLVLFPVDFQSVSGLVWTTALGSFGPVSLLTSPTSFHWDQKTEGIFIFKLYILFHTSVESVDF